MVCAILLIRQILNFTFDRSTYYMADLLHAIFNDKVTQSLNAANIVKKQELTIIMGSFQHFFNF